ncbi:hypothetical protein NPX13_g374 [Xylaria arbuscula]|uniref:Uncharacterized protein n=1 Tax=Xylaria arbuscula TaxID=114810 RepID=A0A9W8NPH6_9PEZI|nr:hypothetical protein NPX13_g374 [Xylaria arbuscula]
MLSSLLGSRAERHQQEDFYPIASDTNSIYASSNTGKAGPSSAIYTDPSVRSLGPDSEGDYEVNDQMSTEPVPADFNYQTVIAPSSPSSSVHHLPITRSKARARAQALKRSENEDLGDPIEDADLQEPERYNDEHLPLPNSPRRKPAPKKAKSRTKVLRNDSFDGSVDERDSNSLGVPGDSASGSGSYISSPRGDEDDIYSLYETDAGGEDSEASAIADITNRSDRKGKGRAITTTYSAKSGNKKVSKTRRAVGAAKKTGAHSANKPTKSQKPVRGNQVPDVPNGESTKRAILAPVSCQNTQVPTQASLGTVSASYSAIQKALSPLAARSKGPTHRKPKKPFDASNLDRSNTSLQGVSPSHGDTSIYQHSMTQPRSTGSSPSTEIEPPVGKIAHTTSQNTRSTLSVPSFKPERKTYHPSERSSNAKQEGRSITCNQQDAHPNKLSDPFTVPSPEQHANSTSAEYGHTHPRIRPSYDAGGGPSKRPSGVEPSIRPIEKVKAAPKRKAPFDDIQASTAVSSPRADADPVYCRRLSDLPGDADLADHSVAETLHPDNYGGNPGENEEFPGDYGSRYESSVPMQIDETPKPPSMEDIPSRIGAHSKQAANKKLLSPNVHASSEISKCLYRGARTPTPKFYDLGSELGRYLAYEAFDIDAFRGTRRHRLPRRNTVNGKKS